MNKPPEVPEHVKEFARKVYRFAELNLPPNVGFLFMLGSLGDPGDSGWQYFAGNLKDERSIAGALREAADAAERKLHGTTDLRKGKSE